MGDGDGITTPDPYTVKLHLFRPAPFMNRILTVGFSGIVAEGTTREQLQRQPYGSGPYLLKEYVRGSILRAVRNPNYFKEGLPYLDGVNMAQIKDETAGYSAFLTNRLDFAALGFRPDFFPQMQQMEQQGRIVIFPYATNCRPQGVNMNSTTPPFDNLKVRQAVNLVIDRKAYIEVVHEGHAQPALVFAPGGPSGRTAEDMWDKVPGFGTGAKKQQEVEEAKRLMAEAGFAEGFETEQLVRDTGGYMRQGEFISGELAKIGIRTKQTILDSSALFARTAQLDYTLWAYWFCQITNDADEMWGAYFVTGGSRNWLGYSNPQVDELYIQQSAELDPAKRTALNRQIEDIILRDLPFAPLADQEGNHTWWSYVKNYEFGLTFYTTAYNRKEDWWIDKS